MNFKNCIAGFVLCFIAIILSSCADTGIVKRKYMPGYYVSKSSRTANFNKAKQEQPVKQDTSSITPVEAPSVSSSDIIKSKVREVVAEKIKAPAKKHVELLKKHRHSSIQSSKNKGKAATTSLADEEDPFDPLAIIAMALVSTGVLLLLLPFFIVGSVAFVFIFLALVFIIAGFVSGLRSRKRIDESGDRGIGLALAAITIGAVIFALALIILVFALLFLALFGA